MGFDIMQTELGQKLNRFGYALYNQVIWVSVLKRPSLRTFILDLVREDQLLEQGIDEDGDVIGTYSEYTEIINPEKVAGSHYTLKDTGEFFDGETTNLFYEYGEGIMGLTTESLDKLSREILRLYAIEVRRFLQV